MVNVLSTVPTTTRRKNPVERRAEIVAAASRLAVDEGLERVTAKGVAAQLGVVPGLVNHYFAAVDDLVAASFGHAVTAERTAIYGTAAAAATPLEQLRTLLAELLDPSRDSVSLLWLDAWQASRRRPALLDELVIQMNADHTELTRIIQAGADAAQFVTDDASVAALRIMSLIDGHSIQAATRSRLDYRPVAEFVIRTVEREVGLPVGKLALAPR